jgi:hypothetical protein
MQTILDEFRRYMRLARTAATTAVSEEYRRGYLPGLRRHYRMGPFPTQDEHAQCLRLADNPEYAEVVRGYRDGLAGVEPQP